MKTSTVPELIEEIRQGRMIVLMDDEDRENEGDLVMAADFVTPAAINFMATHARGLICLTLSEQRCEQLQLPLMVDSNGTELGTNFTASIEAAVGVTTGISAADRATTVKAAVARDAKASDIVQPGHIFPLKAQRGGVLHRAGHTEAGCDYAKLAGFEPAAVIVEIMNEDGTMARRPDLEVFAEKHDLKLGTIADLIEYRVTHEKSVELKDEWTTETKYGEFTIKLYYDEVDETTHTVMMKGEIAEDTVPLVRVHLMNIAKDVIGLPQAGTWSFDTSLKTLAEAECGIMLLLGNTIDSTEQANQIRWFLNGHDIDEKHQKETSGGGYKTIGAGSQILRDLSVTKMKLLSQELKFNALSGFDLEIMDYVESPEDLA